MIKRFFGINTRQAENPYKNSVLSKSVHTQMTTWVWLIFFITPNAIAKKNTSSHGLEEANKNTQVTDEDSPLILENIVHNNNLPITQTSLYNSSNFQPLYDDQGLDITSFVLLILAAAIGLGLAASSSEGEASSIGGDNNLGDSNLLLNDNFQTDDTPPIPTKENSIFNQIIFVENPTYNNRYLIEDFLSNESDYSVISVDDPDNIFVIQPTLSANDLSFQLRADSELFDSAVVTISDQTVEYNFSITQGSSQIIAHTPLELNNLLQASMEIPLDALHQFNPQTSLYVSTNTTENFGNYTLVLNGIPFSGELTIDDPSTYWTWSYEYPYHIYNILLTPNQNDTYDLTVSLDDTIIYSEVGIDTLTIELSDIGSPYLQISEDSSDVVISSDPLVANQWHLFNMEVFDAWKVATGDGVTVGIVEGYFQENHQDLIDNVSVSIPSHYINGSIPSSHATSVAGIIAATGSNGLGLIGTAPLASIVSLDNEADRLFEIDKDIAVYSNSWGPTDSVGISTTDWSDILDSAQNAYKDGDSVLFANGNGTSVSDQSAYDPLVSSPFTLAISAINDQGQATWFNEFGSNILACTYSNGDDSHFGITSTDINNSYTDSFGGTSAATPIAAGVTALMKSINNSLTARDITSIFAETSLKIDFISDSWQTNLAGFDTSYHYGFGLINTPNAVVAARDNLYLISDHPLEIDSYSSSQLFNNNHSKSITIDTDDKVVEQVVLEIENINYTGGDEHLNISLTHESLDQSFTSTVLFPVTNISEQNYDDLSVVTLQHFGESQMGAWSIRVFDTLSESYLLGSEFDIGLEFFMHDESITI